MKDVDSFEGKYRVRFMTSHPKDASEELLDVVATEEKVVKHFHLPVQSGSTEVLRRMNRRYSAEHYMGIIDSLKANAANEDGSPKKPIPERVMSLSEKSP